MTLYLLPSIQREVEIDVLKTGNLIRRHTIRASLLMHISQPISILILVCCLTLLPIRQGLHM